MRIAASILLVKLCWCLTVQFAGAQSVAVADFIESPPPGSLVLKQLAARELLANWEPSEVRAEANRYSASDALRRAQTGYLNSQSRARTGLAILKANNLMIKTVLSVGLASASGPYALVTKKVVEVAADKGLGALERAAEKSLREESERALRSSLALYRREYGIANLTNLGARGIVDELEHRGYLPATEIDPKLDAEGRSIVLESMVRELADADIQILNQLADNGDRIGSLEEIQRENVEAIGNLQRFSVALWKATVEHSERISRIEDNVREIRVELDAVRSRVDENAGDILVNRSDIEYLQQTMFGRMTPKEQAAALRGGFFRGMDPAKRQELEQRVETAARRQQVADDIAEYAGHAASVYNIAQNLGVSGDLLQGLGVAAEFGQVAQQAAGAWASGNVLGMASALTNVIGIGGPSPATQRHQQLVGLLKGVLKNQEEMLESLGRIEDRQIQMLRNQEEIFKAIIELSEQIERQHDEVLAGLDEIKTEIRVNRNGILATYVGGIFGCDNVLYFFPESPEKYSGLVVQYEGLPDEMDDCLEDLAKAVRGIGQSDAAFSAEWWFKATTQDGSSAAGKQSAEFVEQIWKPLWSFTQVLLSDQGVPTEHLVSSLLTPSNTMQNLDEKWDAIQGGDGGLVARVRNLPGARNVQLSEVFGAYYSLDATRWVLGHLRRFYPIWELQSPGVVGRLLSFEEVMSRPKSSRQAELRIQLGTIRSDVLVAQQALLSGEGLLPLLYRAFAEKEVDSPVFRGLVSVISANPLLSKNFIKYAVRRHLRNNDLSALDYHFAITAPRADDAFLRKLFAEEAKWDFEWIESEGDAEGEPNAGNWCVRFEAVCLAMPSPTDVLSGFLDYRPQLTLALSEQAAMLDHLNGFRVFDPATTAIRSDRHALGAMLIAQ